MTAEHFSLYNTASGRFDPYLFSNMSLFMPDKYKVDSSVVSYYSYGMFGEKQANVRPWWHLDAILSISRVKAISFASTREYDFSQIIPRLINPTKTVFIDQDAALIIMRITNGFDIDKATVSAHIQQALPIDLKPKKNINGPPAGNNIKMSIRGGTRYGIGVGYGF